MSAAEGPGGLSSDELRAAVRAVLRDVLPREVLTRSAPVPSTDPVVGLQPGPATNPVAGGGAVVLRDDADLDALVRRVAEACADPERRAALAAGRHDYRLARDQQDVNERTLRVERGAVTERTVQRAATDGARLVVGRRAVLTPLARDRARSLGVSVEKES